ncbi:MAG TPA: ABC transporter permease subunit [Gemmataceae bacterium]|nr:ABC transporter permease subunit [Gemmataceae bacterium]
MRRTFSLSNSLQAWRERIGLVAVLGGAVLLYLFADLLNIGQQLLLGISLLLVAGILVRRQWFTLAGPVLRHDMVRAARRSRFTLYRLYAYFVTILLAFSYAVWYARTRHGEHLSMRETADFAQGFLYGFLAVQVLAVCVLAPGYLAGVITDEKERRTLEYLLATDLRNREIVLGKLGARFANLGLMLLTGLPIVSLMELMGGVEPLLVLAGFGVALMTAFSLAGLCGLTSVYARTTRTALVLVYLTLFMYLVLSAASMSLSPALSVRMWRLGPVTVTGADLIDSFTAGNPFVQTLRVARDFAAGAGALHSLAARVRDYALFHAMVGVFCTAWATLRLRTVFHRQADRTPAPAARRIGRLRRPRIGEQPMLWKEIFAEEGLRLGRSGRLLLAILFVGSFLSFFSFLRVFSPRGFSWGQFPYVVSLWAAVMGCMVACLLLLAVAVRAANSLSGERDRQTLDGLLATPLEARAILFAKWLGSIVSVRLGWLWVGLIWVLGWLMGVWYGWVIGVLVLAWLVYAAFLAAIGLWFSLVSRTSSRATIYTLGTALVMALLFLAPIHTLFFDDDPATQAWARPLYQFQRGLSPPTALGYLLPYPRERPTGWPTSVWDFQTALWGLLIWTAATVFVWLRLNKSFRKQMNR